MTKEALKYLQAGAIVPVDMETTILLVNALKEALAQPAQDSMQYLTFGHAIKAKLRRKTMDEDDDDTQVYKKPWVDLTDDEIEVIEAMALTKQWAIRMALAAVKEKNL